VPTLNCNITPDLALYKIPVPHWRSITKKRVETFSGVALQKQMGLAETIDAVIFPLVAFGCLSVSSSWAGIGMFQKMVDNLEEGWKNESRKPARMEDWKTGRRA
jgi:hypothetical protein